MFDQEKNIYRDRGVYCKKEERNLEYKRDRTKEACSALFAFSLGPNLGTLLQSQNPKPINPNLIKKKILILILRELSSAVRINLRSEDH